MIDFKALAITGVILAVVVILFFLVILLPILILPIVFFGFLGTMIYVNVVDYINDK